MGIKSRSCCTINNIDSRNYNMGNSEMATKNSDVQMKHSNYLLVPQNTFMSSSQHDFKNPSILSSCSRSSSFPNEESSFQILHKDDGYNSVIINIPNIPSLQNKSTTNFSTHHCCLPSCSKSEENDVDSISSMKQKLLISNEQGETLIISNSTADHHDVTNSESKNLTDSQKIALQNNFNATMISDDQFRIPSCSNSNCSASWCSICSFSSKYDTECCSICNCNSNILKNDSLLMRSLSLPTKCKVINDVQQQLPTFIERTSSCKVTKAEILENQNLDFCAID